MRRGGDARKRHRLEVVVEDAPAGIRIDAARVGAPPERELQRRGGLQGPHLGRAARLAPRAVVLHEPACANATPVSPRSAPGGSRPSGGDFAPRTPTDPAARSRSTPTPTSAPSRPARPCAPRRPRRRRRERPRRRPRRPARASPSPRAPPPTAGRRIARRRSSSRRRTRRGRGAPTRVEASRAARARSTPSSTPRRPR